MSNSSDIVYLDYAASTPIDERVIARMQEVQRTTFANPGSTHVAGRQSMAVVTGAARQLGGLLNVDPDTLLWTSGATESDNLAIQGAARHRAHRGKHLITMRTEHKAVVDVFKELEKQGFAVTWLSPGDDGHVRAEDLAEALRDDTQLVSIMHINNETGIVQDIESLGSVCRDRKVLFHVDAAQSVGKVHLDLQALPVDLLSLTGHKFYGPNGIGALYVSSRPGVHIEPLMWGGGQQRRLRPGTLPVEMIAGLGAAAEIAATVIDDEYSRLSILRETLWEGIRDLEGVHVNGDLRNGYPGILNVGIDNVDGESLLLALEPLCVATGSACNSQSQEPSYVLRAMGRSDLQAQSAIRFSFGRQTQPADVKFAAETYRGAIERLRSIAPERAT
jgi:cysteine desulfurase